MTLRPPIPASPDPGPTASLTPADAADVTDELVTTEHVLVTPDGELPYTAAEDSLAHLAIARERHDDIEHHYPADHMMYVHEPSRVQQSADLRDFVRRRSGGPA